MKKILKFLIELSKLKGKTRRGWELHKIKNGETTAEHIFHLTFLVWLLGKKEKINLERALKIALVHDICEIYAPDFTSYDAAGIKDKKSLKNISKIKPVASRPTNEQRKLLEKIKQKLETKSMKKLLKNLSPELKNEIWALWQDYENGYSKEARFVKQADKLINLFQGLEYAKQCKDIKKNLWLKRAKEVLDNPTALSFLRELEKYYFKKS